MEFLKTEREIEVKLADVEKQDKGGSRPASPIQSDIDSQVDAKVLGQYSKFELYTEWPKKSPDQTFGMKS